MWNIINKWRKEKAKDTTNKIKFKLDKVDRNPDISIVPSSYGKYKKIITDIEVNSKRIKDVVENDDISKKLILNDIMKKSEYQLEFDKIFPVSSNNDLSQLPYKYRIGLFLYTLMENKKVREKIENSSDNTVVNTLKRSIQDLFGNMSFADLLDVARKDPLVLTSHFLSDNSKLYDDGDIYTLFLSGNYSLYLNFIKPVSTVSYMYVKLKGAVVNIGNGYGEGRVSVNKVYLNNLTHVSYFNSFSIVTSYRFVGSRYIPLLLVSKFFPYRIKDDYETLKQYKDSTTLSGVHLTRANYYDILQQMYNATNYNKYVGHIIGLYYTNSLIFKFIYGKRIKEMNMQEQEFISDLDYFEDGLSVQQIVDKLQQLEKDGIVTPLFNYEKWVKQDVAFIDANRAYEPFL